jgi:hypothetical protein
MKKILAALVLSLVAVASASAYYNTSAYRNSTAGVLYNEFDNIADGLYIFDVTNNVLGLGSGTLGA